MLALAWQPEDMPGFAADITVPTASGHRNPEDSSRIVWTHGSVRLTLDTFECIDHHNDIHADVWHAMRAMAAVRTIAIAVADDTVDEAS